MQFGGHDITSSLFSQLFCGSTFKTTEILLTRLKKRRERIVTNFPLLIMETVPV